MQAITIRQPHASLIMAGIKTIETRSRPTKIRGRVLIHAGLHFSLFDKLDARVDTYVHEALIKLGQADESGFNVKAYNDLPRGAILGSVEIVDCIPGDIWLETHNGKADIDRIKIYEREYALGNIHSNMFCWILKDPYPWPNPIAEKGKQGFWNFDIYGPKNVSLIKGNL